jgi:ribosomal protein S18 acetylase RimI-like enzyme
MGEDPTAPRIRPASDGDLLALTAYPGQEVRLAKRLAGQQAGLGVLLVADVAGEPVGRVYVQFEPADEPEIREHLPSAALLVHLWVRRDCRKRHIGTALLAHAENVARQHGRRVVALGVLPENVDAIRLYERIGYEQWPYGLVHAVPETFSQNGNDQLERCLVYVRELSRG